MIKSYTSEAVLLYYANLFSRTAKISSCIDVIMMSFFEFFHFCWGIFFKKFEFLFSDIWQKKWKSNQNFYFLTFGRKSENRIKKTRRNAVILCDFHWFFMLSQYTFCALAWWLMEINYCNFTDIRFSFLLKGKTNTNTPN